MVTISAKFTQNSGTLFCDSQVVERRSEPMRRVLPMMFVCVSVVGFAVFHAHSQRAENIAYLVPEAAPVEAHRLTQ